MSGCFFCASTQPWCLGEYLLQPGVLTYPTPDAASSRNGGWLITWWVIILCSGGADWRMILAVPLPVKGKWVMCVLRLLKGREHPKYPTFREVLSMKECGKRTSETEQNSDAEHYYQITVWYHHHPTYLFGIILCHKRVRRFFAQVHDMFFHPLWSDYVMLKVIQGDGRKALHTKNPKQLFFQGAEPLQFGGLMHSVNSKQRQMLCRHG